MLVEFLDPLQMDEKVICLRPRWHIDKEEGRLVDHYLHGCKYRPADVSISLEKTNMNSLIYFSQ